MKHLATGLLAAFCILTSVVQAAEQGSLQGSWALVSAVYTKADGTVVRLSGQDLKSVKVLSKSHFSFVTVHKDGSFSSALTGRYQLTGDSYHETPETGSVPGMLNKTYEFKAKVENDLWHHSGMEDGVQIAEVWQRLD